MMKKYVNICKTVRCVMGINEGYFHKNENKNDIYTIIQKISEDYFNETNVYIPFVVSDSRTIYRPYWGCPYGGEKTFTLETSPDPEFYVTKKQVDEYVEHAYELLLRISEYFKQYTIRIETTDKVLVTKYKKCKGKNE